MVTTITVEEEVEEVSTTIATTETTEATEAEGEAAAMAVGATLAAATGTTVEGATLQAVVVMAEANTAIIPATTIREPWASLRPLGTGVGSIATTDRVAVTGEANIVTGKELT